MTTELEDLAEFDDLRVLMTGALAELDVPTARLRERATVDGRRLRRRRRALVAVGGLAAAAAAAAFTVPLIGGSGTTARDGGYADTPTAAATSLAEPPHPFVDRPGWWDMPAAEMASRLSALLPRHVTLASYETTIPDPGPGRSSARIGDLGGTVAARTGPGSVEVMLTQLSDQAVLDAARSAGETWGDQDFGCPPDLGDPAVQVRTCATRADAAGQVVERQLETLQGGVTYREVRLVTDGGIVYAATANSTQRKWTAPPSASHNPLTLDQLARIASSTTWTDWTPPSGG